MRGLLAMTVTIIVGVAASRAAPPPQTVGLIPADETAITLALADGVRLAFEQAARDGLAIQLVVGGGATQWSNAAAPAVDLAFDSQVLALITPPDRATAHLIAQIGSRAHIPVLATTEAPSIGSTGSYWIIPVVDPGDERPSATVDGEPIGSDLELRSDGEPGDWTEVGYRAGSILARAIRDHGNDRYRLARAMKAAAGSDSARLR